MLYSSHFQNKEYGISLRNIRDIMKPGGENLVFHQQSRRNCILKCSYFTVQKPSYSVLECRCHSRRFESLCLFHRLLAYSSVLIFLSKEPAKKLVSFPAQYITFNL